MESLKKLSSNGLGQGSFLAEKSRHCLQAWLDPGVLCLNQFRNPD